VSSVSVVISVRPVRVDLVIEEGTSSKVYVSCANSSVVNVSINTLSSVVRIIVSSVKIQVSLADTVKTPRSIVLDCATNASSLILFNLGNTRVESNIGQLNLVEAGRESLQDSGVREVVADVVQSRQQFQVRRELVGSYFCLEDNNVAVLNRLLLKVERSNS